MNELAGRLKSVRAHFGLSTIEMARCVGLKNRKSWEGYERAVSAPKADVLYILACHGIDPWWLLSGEGEMTRKTASEEAEVSALPADKGSAIDPDLLQRVLEEAARYNRDTQMFDGFSQMARAISCGYSMIENERAKGNEVSLDALHFVMKAGAPEKHGSK